MATKPYLTTNDIIESVKRRISFPTSQSTFTDEDIVRFANEEIFISQVPSVLVYHEEYFVTTVQVPLRNNINHYAIPNRAIGMRMRDLFYVDTNNNIYDMAKINPEEKAWFQRDFNTGGSNPYPYYLQGNEFFLPASSIPNPVGNFQISFFIRPNQLVTDENAAIIESFGQTLTIDNSLIANGDQITLTDSITGAYNTYTALTSGSPVEREFLVGATSALTAINLTNTINVHSEATATVSGAVVTWTWDLSSNYLSTTNEAAFLIPDEKIINFDKIPTNIVNTAVIDFLQTNPGHRIISYDIKLGTNVISGTSITFPFDDVPTSTIVGDYICLANNAIIPYLPPDLHTVVAERTAARILASIGDLQSLEASNQKIAEMEKNQGTLLDNRVDGDPSKVSNRHSLLRYGRRSVIRRF